MKDPSHGEGTTQVKPMISQHPGYQPLVNKLAGLYSHITAKALENEQKS